MQTAAKPHELYHAKFSHEPAGSLKIDSYHKNRVYRTGNRDPAHPPAYQNTLCDHQLHGAPGLDHIRSLLLLRHVRSLCLAILSFENRWAHIALLRWIDRLFNNGLRRWRDIGTNDIVYQHR